MEDLLLKVVAKLEGFEPVPAPDPVGLYTVGYGHKVKPGEEFARPLSHGEALLLLEKDLEAHRKDVDRLFRGVFLASHEVEALTSFTFNVGASRIMESTLRRRVLHADRMGAAHEFCRWVWDTERDGTKIRLPGLVRRRDLESVWFLGAHPHTVARMAGLDPGSD